MAQLFSNNADTQLSAPLTNVGTSATLADGSGLNTPTGGDYELLTLIAGTDVEIVSMTARTGNTITITRAQEGTTAIAWGTGTRIFAGITAGTMTAPLRNNATQAGSLAVGAGAAATGISATAFGADAAVALGGAAFGNGADAAGEDSTAVGRFSYAGGLESVAISSAYIDDLASYGVAIGPYCEVGETHGFAAGFSALSYGVGAGAVGRNAQSYADNAWAVGTNAYTNAPNSLHMAALPIVPSGSVAAADCAWRKSAPAVVIMSAPVSLTATTTHTIPMPSGVTFYPEEVGIIVTAANTVTGQPTVRFGATSAETRYLAATETVGLDAARKRARYITLASNEGSTTLAAEITIAGAATTLTGQFYWRGFAVQQ